MSGVGGDVRAVPGGATPEGGWAPRDNEETGGQDSTQGRAVLDPGSPYRHLKQQDAGAYVKVQMTGHPIAGKDGRGRLHRFVLYDAIEEGPHDCALCGVGGLDWHVDRTDREHYLTVDHIDGDGLNDRRANLRPAHKWCNDNRHVVEHPKHGIGWAFVATIPVLDRRPLWNHRQSCPTGSAFEYQRRARGIADPPAQTPPAEETAAGGVAADRRSESGGQGPRPRSPQPTPIRRGLRSWEDLLHG